MKKIIALIVVVIITIFVIVYQLFNYNYEKELANLKINDIALEFTKDGVYKGSYSIFPITAEVEVTVKDHLITNIDIIKHVTGQGTPAEVIVDDVIESQSLDVDTISGATGSSKVILKAIDEALN